MKILNNYFFNKDKICLTDLLWFYGSVLFLIIFVGLTIISAVNQIMVVK